MPRLERDAGQHAKEEIEKELERNHGRQKNQEKKTFQEFLKTFFL